MGFLTDDRPVVQITSVVVLALFAAACGGGEAETTPTDPASAAVSVATTMIATTTTETSAEPSPHNPNIQPINCRSLLKIDDMEEAINVWDREGGPANTFGFSEGEACGDTIDGDEDSFVRVEPGDPADFDSSAVFLGASSQPVADVGEAAVWFGGTGSDSHAGLLAVRQDTSLGELYFRITLGRPELDDADRRAAATTLAAAMLPRFPGMGGVQPEGCSDNCDPSGYYWVVIPSN